MQALCVYETDEEKYRMLPEAHIPVQVVTLSAMPIPMQIRFLALGQWKLGQDSEENHLRTFTKGNDRQQWIFFKVEMFTSL